MTRVPLIAAVALTTVIGAGPGGAPDDAGRWTARVETLDPDDPMAYFELAEEIADASPQQRALAQHLFALAGVLDPPRLGRSACLALADLEEDAHAKRRLLALAALLDERAGGLMAGPAGDVNSFDRASVLAVADALSYYRAGNGAKATAALHGSGARLILDTYETVFRGSERFLEDCRLYRGSRRPVIDEQDRIRLLRFEAALLEGEDRSWSGELLLTGGRPLIEVDPDRLEASFGVNGAKPCFRDGHWQAKN